LINGGNLQYDPFHGQPKNAVYDPSTNLFTDVQNMAHGRWYPTATVLGDGRVMTFSGLSETGSTNTAVEFYTAGSGWSAESAAGWTPPLYPRMHLLKDGRVLYSGSGTGSRIFNPTTKTWTAVVATTNYSGTRTYGTSVLLPLSPADGYQSRVMIFGGGNPATTTTEILDLSAASLHWTNGPPMSQPRIEMNATILPNGKVLATGGSTNDEDLATASLNADLYDPATNTFTPAGVNVYPRLYHSGSLLLPDATVALLGGNPTRGSYESHIEIYSPAYLFNVDGSPAVRPTIAGVTPGPLALGGTFQVQTPNAADIASVVLVRPGVPTHAFDMDQRLVRLPYSSGSGVLDVTAPPDGNIAPPGYYMLFVLNSAGVPSIATFVQLTPPAANQAPQASIVSPAANVTVNPGQAVSFSGSGTDSGGTIASYSWTFPGGNPASSSQASPGNVTYSSPGTYVASFTVTDNGGLTTSPPATRTVVVTDFSLSATPASRAVDPGSNATYTATVTPGAGFTGVVTFGVTGLPAGATAAFAPASVTGSGATTLTVSTNASTPSGTYPLRITATSGPVSHSFDVTLVVNVVVVGDFTITATPASRTIPNGNSTTYSIAIAPNGGFSSSVTLSVGALPKFATASFSPASLASGTSTLTLSTKKQTKAGSYSVVITASGGGRTHTSTVTVIVQ
jgi:PKD repeat protein